MTPAELLLAAADHIDKVGWWQGDSYALSSMLPHDVAPCCAVAALVQAAPAAWNTRCRALGVLVSHVGAPVPDWNDAPGQTQEKVTAAMREAAEALIRERE